MLPESNAAQPADFRLFNTRSTYVSGHMRPVLPGRWALPAMQVLGRETKRYSVIHGALPHVTQKVLTQTLRKLERNGIIFRRVYPTIPPQVEYTLTPLGLDLLKLTGVVSEWIATHGNHITRAQKAYDRRMKL